MMLPHFSRDDDIETVAAAIQSRGAVVIDELLPDNIVADLSADLRPEFDREGHLYQNAFNGHQTLLNLWNLELKQFHDYFRARS